MGQIIPFPNAKTLQDIEASEPPFALKNMVSSDDLLVAVLEARNRMATVTEGLELIRQRLAEH